MLGYMKGNTDGSCVLVYSYFTYVLVLSFSLCTCTRYILGEVLQWEWPLVEQGCSQMCWSSRYHGDFSASPYGLPSWEHAWTHIPVCDAVFCPM